MITLLSFGGLCALPLSATDPDTSVTLLRPAGIPDLPGALLRVELPRGSHLAWPDIDPTLLDMGDRCGPEDTPPDLTGFTCEQELCGFGVRHPQPQASGLRIAGGATARWIGSTQVVTWEIPPTHLRPIPPSQVDVGVPDVEGAKRIDAWLAQPAHSDTRALIASFLSDCAWCSDRVRAALADPQSSPTIQPEARAVGLTWSGGSYTLIAENAGYNQSGRGDAIRVAP